MLIHPHFVLITKSVFECTLFSTINSVGKTSVINKLVRDTFEATYQPTTGANHDNKSLNIDGQLVTLQLWDNEAEGVAFYKGADAFGLCDSDAVRAEALLV